MKDGAGDNQNGKNAKSSGDPTAVEQLLTRHLADLAAFVHSHADPLLRRRESCSDVTQSVCREVLQDRNNFEFRGESAFRSWLFTLALRKLVNRRRHYLAQRRDVRRERVVDESELRGAGQLHAEFGSPSQGAIARETAGRLEHAFGRLPPDYRTVITLARFRGLSHRDVAAAMGREQGAVRTLLNRALVRLSRLIAEVEPSMPID